MCEEFEITKTSKHNNKQRRILIIDGNIIYHKKQCVDQRTGQVRPPHNYFSQQSGHSDMNQSADQLFISGSDLPRPDSGAGRPSGNPYSSFRADSGEDSSKKPKVGVMQKL